MEKSERQALFISHATPEDNEFALWLGSRLSAAGYEVWADVLRLRGGHDWQRLLEEALRNKAFKVLLVGTPVGVQKQGVRNEIQIASDTGRKIGDKSFIIPLRLELFEAPFLIAHAQYIDFMRGWGPGLAELLETLDTEYRVPRESGPNIESIDRWKAAYQHRAQVVKSEPEFLISNWLAVKSWPEKLRHYAFINPVEHSRIGDVVSGLRCPAYAHRRGFLGFGSLDDYAPDLSPAFAVCVDCETPAQDFFTEGERRLSIDRQQGWNITSRLVSSGWDRFMAAKGLLPYEYADKARAWWVPKDVLESDMISFRWPDGPQGRRALTGEHKRMHWHLALSAKVWFGAEPHVRVLPRIVFTTDGKSVLDDVRAAHRLRRSVARNWRNDKWRDMLLAFLFWLSDGGDALRIPLASASFLELEVPPVRMSAPVSILAQGNATEIEDADPESGDVVFEINEDDLENVDGDASDDGADD